LKCNLKIISGVNIKPIENFHSSAIIQLRYVGRDHLGAPATGIGDIHRAEAAQLLKDTFS